MPLDDGPSQPFDGPPELAWLLDTSKNLVIEGADWRKKQEQVRALDPWFYTPTERVRHIALCLSGKRTDADLEISEEDWEEIRVQCEDDAVFFVHFFCFYKDRDPPRRKKLAYLSASQLAVLWRFMCQVDEGLPVRIALLKARQGGFSWLFCQLVLWMLCFKKHIGALCMSHEKKATQRIFGYLKEGHSWLPQELRPTKDYSNRNELSLRTPEKLRDLGHDEGQDSVAIVDTAGNDFPGTSVPIQFAHVSEIGKWHKVCSDPEQIYTSFTNAIQDEPGTVIVAESTAHGAETFWHNMWKAAMKAGAPGWNGFTAVFVPWYFDERNARKAPPDMVLSDRADSEWGNEVELARQFDLSMDQLYWRRKTIMKQGEGRSKVDTFNQEHPGTQAIAWLYAHGKWMEASVANDARMRISEEVASGRLKELFQGDVLALRDTGIEAATVLEPFRERNNWLIKRALGPLRIFRWPDWRQDYIIGCDVAEGLSGGDASCFKVFQREGSPPDPESGNPGDDNRNMRLCAEFYGWTGEDNLADLLWRMGYFYSTGKGSNRIPALLAWERTGPGRGIASWLRLDRPGISGGYPASRMYRMHSPDNRKVFRQEAVYGISTNSSTKSIMMREVMSGVESGQVQLTHEDLAEMETVTRDDRGRLETGGRDRVMAIAMAMYAIMFSQPTKGKDDKKEENPPRHSVKYLLAKRDNKLQTPEDDEGYELLS